MVKKLSVVEKKLTAEQRKSLIYLDAVDMYLLEVSPKSLDDNPKNWRIHTQRQRSTYKAFKAKYGWASFPVYNVASNRLLDGHMRVDEAIKAGETSIYVILKHLTEDQENEFLASFDSIGLMAQRNNEALESLTQASTKAITTIKNDADRKLAQLQKDLLHQSKSKANAVVLAKSPPIRRETMELEEEESKPEKNFQSIDDAPIVEERLNDTAIFDGLSWLGIPELREDGLATDFIPTRTYARDEYGYDAYFCISCGSLEVDKEIGTLGFYTEDYRFETAYTNGEAFVDWLEEIKPKNIISPDFSTYADWPMVLRIYNLYRSRWCARFWQELGFDIIPTIQYMGDDKTTIDYALKTLPKKIPIVAIQCRMANNQGIIKFIKMIEKYVQPQNMILYGGREKQKYIHGKLPTSIKYHYLTQYTEQRRKTRKKSNA